MHSVDGVRRPHQRALGQRPTALDEQLDALFRRKHNLYSAVADNVARRDAHGYRR
jgi:hypothetical protein